MNTNFIKPLKLKRARTQIFSFSQQIPDQVTKRIELTEEINNYYNFFRRIPKFTIEVEIEQESANGKQKAGKQREYLREIFGVFGGRERLRENQNQVILAVQSYSIRTPK